MLNQKLVTKEQAYFLKLNALNFKDVVSTPMFLVGTDIERYGRDRMYSKVYLFVLIDGEVSCVESNYNNIVDSAIEITAVFGVQIMKNGKEIIIEQSFNDKGDTLYSLKAVQEPAETTKKTKNA